MLVRHVVRFGLVASVALTLGQVASAQTAWTGAGTNLWVTAGNWTAGTPTNVVEAQFYNSGAANLSISIGAVNRNAAGLVFNANADSPVVISTSASNQITLGATGNASYITVDVGAAAAHEVSAGLAFSGTDTTWTINNASGFTASGPVNIGSNTRAFTKAGSGTATLSGSTVDLRGPVTVSGGTLLLTGTPGDSYFLPTSGNSNMSLSGKIDMRGGDGSINGTITGSGEFTNGGGTTRTLTLSRGTGYTLDALISGNLALTKSAAAVTSVTNANTYTGGTSIVGGRFLADNATGSALGTGDAVINGGRLGGTGGTVGASGDAVNITFGSSGGFIEPGNGGASPTPTAGKLTVFGGVDFTSAGDANFQVKLNGLTPGTGGYDQLEQTGAVNLSAGVADLIVSMNLVSDPANGTAFIIMNRPGSQAAATGTFEGLPSTGSSLIVNNAGTLNTPITMYIDYAYNSGDGFSNDVALVVGTLAVPEPASIGLLALGGLLFFRRRRA